MTRNNFKLFAMFQKGCCLNLSCMNNKSFAQNGIPIWCSPNFYPVYNLYFKWSQIPEILQSLWSAGTGWGPGHPEKENQYWVEITTKKESQYWVAICYHLSKIIFSEVHRNRVMILLLVNHVLFVNCRETVRIGSCTIIQKVFKIMSVVIFNTPSF